MAIATTISMCLINQKGGCGKSSSCFHLAGALALQDHRVLLVDADPQGSLSQAFLGSSTVENLPAASTLAALFDDHSATPRDFGPSFPGGERHAITRRRIAIASG